jgi:hypothetical protein
MQAALPSPGRVPTMPSIFLSEITGRGAQPSARCYHLTSGNSFIERLQAARHSTLVMCVAASQKPMQSASVLPPPPGALGADSLGLLLPEFPGERARLGAPPPPVANWLGKGSAMGASPGCAVGVGVATPPGGVNPPDGVGDNDVDGADGVVELVAGLVVELGDVRVVEGDETLGAARDVGAPAEERACANAASGRTSTTTMAAKTDGLGVSIAITMAFTDRTPLYLVTIGSRFCGVHKLASQVHVTRRPPIHAAVAKSQGPVDRPALKRKRSRQRATWPQAESSDQKRASRRPCAINRGTGLARCLALPDWTAAPRVATTPELVTCAVRFCRGRLE